LRHLSPSNSPHLKVSILNTTTAPKLLEVRDLKTKFYTVDGVVNALNGVSYSVDKGECLAIVGESGSGKTVGVLSILRLIQSPPGRIVGGSIFFKGTDLLALGDRALRDIRGGAIAVIFQDPMTSLNPIMRIGAQITLVAWIAYHPGLSGGFLFDASVFRGEEPNENRLNIDRPRLDSWAGRVGWRRGPWQAQFSGGRLHEPEWFEPYNLTRLTASIAFDGTVGGRGLATTIAWGENREFTPFRGVADSYLLESDFRLTEATTLYGRGEKVRKEILGLGFHPKGFGHPHIFSDVKAFTIGAVRDLPIALRGRFGVGGDVTLYGMSPDMDAYYAGSRSFHLFVRWRPSATSMTHVH
jgi:ABC-type oligopeptide transport system ATPase subunit